MFGIEDRADEAASVANERTFMFVLTLVVTTVMVGFAVYVLGAAMIDAGGGGSAHRAALAAVHTRA